MSDSGEGPKKPGVPSWQLKTKDESAKEEEKPASETPSRATVIEQARKFLEEGEVRDASTDKKIAFLESKGLQSDEIQELLGVTRNSEATATAPETPQTTPQTSPPPPTSQVPSTQASYTPQQTRDAPPIITYPEFLTTPTQPTPLVTKTRLLTTLYLFSGLSALLYGTNTYLVTPMLASLTTSRLSLAETASTNLSKLISRLESMVSEIPPTMAQKHLYAGEGEKETDSESDSDPTELFHRDIGVQTSLPSTPPSRPTTPSQNTPFSTINDQTSRLGTLKASIQSVIEDSASEGNDSQELEATIGVLREYCDGLAYVTPNYGFGGYGGGASSGREADDEISKVKAGIRGVKGVLLSARSFPGGVRAGVR